MKNFLKKLHSKLFHLNNDCENLKIIHINKEPYMNIGEKTSSYSSLPSVIKKELKHKSRHFTFWKFNDLFGVVCKNETIFINLNHFQKIELFYITPAKAGGYIGLVAFPTQSSETDGVEICYTSPYSEQALQELQQLAENVSTLLGRPIEVVDYGADC